MDKLKAIHYFLTTVEKASFSAAASVFRVPTSSVSRRIADLESYLGTQLIHRTTRHISLTREGELYFEQAQQITLLESRSEALLKELNSSPKGVVTITCVVGYGERYVLPVLQQLRLDYPGIIFRVELSDALSKLHEGGADIAIRGGFAPDEHVIATELMSNEFIPVASPSYLHQSGRPTRCEELKRHKGLFYLTPRGPTKWWANIAGQWQDVSGVEVVSSNSGKWIIAQTLDGEGVAMLPKWAICDYLASGQLVELSFPERLSVNPEKRNSIYLLYRRQQFKDERTTLVVDYLRRHLAKNS